MRELVCGLSTPFVFFVQKYFFRVILESETLHTRISSSLKWVEISVNVITYTMAAKKKAKKTTKKKAAKKTTKRRKTAKRK